MDVGESETAAIQKRVGTVWGLCPPDLSTSGFSGSES